MPTKLHPVARSLLAPPKINSRCNATARLSRIWLESIGRRLTLLQAPPGYGKTTLLTELCNEIKEHGKVPVWLTVTPAINDTANFVNHLIATLRKVEPEFGEATLTLINLVEPLPYDAVITTFINETRVLQKEIYLVIDNSEHILDPDCLNGLLRFIELSSEKLKFVVAQNRSSSLNANNVAIPDDPVVFGMNQLSFSFKETRNLFISSDLNFKEEDIRKLYNSFEGWPAGIFIAIKFFQDNADQIKYIDSFNGNHICVAPYFEQRIFSDLNDAFKACLIKTSVLSSFSSELIGASLQIEGPDALLRKVIDLELYVLPVLHQTGWYRYVKPFKDYLYGQLGELLDSDFNDILIRASKWCYIRKLSVDAIYYSIAADDFNTAANYLDEFSESLFAAGEIDTLMQLADSLPDHFLQEHPVVQLDRAWVYILTWNFTTAERLLNSTRKFLEKNRNILEKSDALYEKLMHRECMLYLIKDKALEAYELLEKWLKKYKNYDPYFVGSIRTSMLYARREKMDLVGAAEESIEIRKLYLEGNTRFGAFWHDTSIGPLLTMQGKLEQATQSYNVALESAIELHGAHSPLAAMPAVMLAEIYYEQNRLDECRHLLSKYYELTSKIGFVDQVIAGITVNARLCVLDNNPDAANEILEFGEELVYRYGFRRVEVNVWLTQIWLFALSQNWKELTKLSENIRSRLADSKALSPGTGAVTTDALLALAWAKIQQALGHHEDLNPLLRRWQKYTESRGCIALSLRFGLEYACVLERNGDSNAALRTLRHTLNVAATHGFLRLFIDEGPLVAGMLERIMNTLSRNDEVIKHYIATLLGKDVRFDESVSGDTSTQLLERETRPSQTLGSKELEILKLVSEDMTNKEIGACLGLSPSTVKWYLQQIYLKLGVKRRMAAVSSARDIGLLK